MSTTSLRQQTNRALAMTAFTACLVTGATVGVAAARADVYDYVAAHSGEICGTLDRFAQAPDPATGPEAAIMKIAGDGLSPEDAGEALALSVVNYCPQHRPEVQAFIDKWSTAKSKSVGA